MSLPTSSPVKRGRPVNVQAPDLQVFNAAAPPVPGATKTEVVDGFLQAMLAYPPKPAVVREFMTPSAAGKWNPAKRVVVYNDATATATRHSVELTGELAGFLDTRGSWESAQGKKQKLNLDLNMVKVDGEWRIANPPPGTIVSSGYFAQNYQQLSMYFFNRAGDVLVPDPVYVIEGEGAATTLVKDLLAGPTRELASVVRTVVPESTTLEVPVTPTDTADVRLSPDVAELSNHDLRMLAAQLAWTLGQDIIGVSRVRLVVNGTALRIPEVDSPSKTFTTSDFAFYDPTGYDAGSRLYALSQGHLVSVSTDSVSRVPGPIGHVDVQARTFAISLDGDKAALVGKHGHQVLVGLRHATGTPSQSRVREWLSEAHNVVAVSWDRREVLWVVDNTEDGAVVYAMREDEDHAKSGPPVLKWVAKAPGLKGKDVSAFAVSRDGTRYAAVVATKKGTDLVVGLIDRDPKHPAQARLIHQHRVVNSDFPLETISSLEWSSPTQIAVLAKSEGSDLQPFEVSIDGSTVTSQLGFLPIRPTGMADAPGNHTPMALVSGGGDLYLRTATEQWQEVKTKRKLSMPQYAG